MYVPRILEAKITKYLSKREFIAIVGPRQVGKTTLMHRIFKKQKNAIFITFEEQDKLTLFEKSMQDFIDLYVKPYDTIFIDEFQYSQNGGKHLKLIFDTVPNHKIIISGSSAIDLTINAIKFLVGRIVIFEMLPFTFAEYLHSQDAQLANLLQNKLKKHETISQSIRDLINPHFQKFLIYGGYPRLVSCTDNDERHTILKNIYDTYILRDVKELINLTDDYKLQKLIEILALQIGNLLSYNNICNILGISYDTLIKYLNFLEKTYIIKQIRPFFTNKSREIVKIPKLYFVDNGLRNSIINNFNNIDLRTDRGAVVENFHLNEFMKQKITPKYWRSKSGAEVDFVIENAGKLTAVEVKSNLKRAVKGKSLYSFMQKYEPENVLIYSDNFVSSTEEVDYLVHWQNDIQSRL